MDNMVMVGITGSMGSGKTTVAKMFGRLGAAVLDADAIAHRALYKNTRVYRQILKRFGRTVLNRDRSINRKKLASTAFRSSQEQRQLCAIVHPWVFAYIDKKIKGLKRKKSIKAVIVEAVLLIESGLYRRVDKTVVIKATQAQQRMRAMKKRKMTLSQVKERMRFQLPLSIKIKYADYVIDNRGTLSNTERQVKNFWKMAVSRQKRRGVYEGKTGKNAAGKNGQ